MGISVKNISILLIVTFSANTISFAASNENPIIVHAWISNGQVFNDSEFTLTYALRTEDGKGIYYDPDIKCHLFVPTNMVILKENNYPDQRGQYYFKILALSAEANGTIYSVFKTSSGNTFGYSTKIKVIKISETDRFIENTWGLAAVFGPMAAFLSVMMFSDVYPVVLSLCATVYGLIGGYYIVFVKDPEWGLSFKYAGEGWWNRIALDTISSEEINTLTLGENHYQEIK